jgi:DNA-binding MarR family transcriptional regulator
MGEGNLCHKVLAVSEEEGATHAAYAMKLLQSEGELTIASTGKDLVTGRLQTHEYTVQGPVQLMMTTTKAVLDEELLNRCLVLSVDEGQAQTEAIFALQKKSQTLQGLLQAERRQHVMALHQHAQRLLRPLRVVNPLVNAIEYSDTRTRARRDHMKYLTLIQSVTLLHQYQRPVKTAKQGEAVIRYIESTEEDLRVAKRLMAALQVADELAPQTARLWSEIQALVRERAQQEGLDPEDDRFSRKEIRQHTGLSATQVQLHIRRLENLEYLVRHRDRHSQRYLYALCPSSEPVSAESRPAIGPVDRQVFDSDVSHIGAAVGLNKKARPVHAMNGAS